MTSRIFRLACVMSLASCALMGLTACFSERVTDTVTARDCLVQVAPPIFGANQTIVAMRDFDFQPDTIRIRIGQVSRG
jgi:hypothetical protein